MLLAILIFLITITLVLWQPRGLGIGWSACGGAAVALLLGVVSPPDVVTVWGIVLTLPVLVVTLAALALRLTL